MAKGRKATDIVEEIARPVCEEMGLILWDVTFEKEGPDWILRILIDKDNEGVFIDECVNVSRAVDPLLDEADPIKQSYNFEVSSAGLGRKLTRPFHFEKKMGQVVLARLIRAVDGVNYNGAINTAAINANTTAQTQKILDAIAGNRMADMQSQINALQLQNAMSGVMRFPSAWTFAGGNFPPLAAATTA